MQSNEVLNKYRFVSLDIIYKIIAGTINKQSYNFNEKKNTKSKKS